MPSAAQTLVLATLIAAGAAPSMPVVTVRAPAADLRLEVALTPEEQQHGLMNRTSLAPKSGMLFVFDRDGPVQFWMKNTLIPLDMIFIGADGTVRRVFRNVAPAPPSLSDANIPREGGDAKYVIELGAGEAKRSGVDAGVHLSIPARPVASP